MPQKQAPKRRGTTGSSHPPAALPVDEQAAAAANDKPGYTHVAYYNDDLTWQISRLQYPRHESHLHNQWLLYQMQHHGTQKTLLPITMWKLSVTKPCTPPLANPSPKRHNTILVAQPTAPATPKPKALHFAVYAFPGE